MFESIVSLPTAFLESFDFDATPTRIVFDTATSRIDFHPRGMNSEFFLQLSKSESFDVLEHHIKYDLIVGRKKKSQKTVQHQQQQQEESVEKASPAVEKRKKKKKRSKRNSKKSSRPATDTEKKRQTTSSAPENENHEQNKRLKEQQQDKDENGNEGDTELGETTSDEEIMKKNPQNEDFLFEDQLYDVGLVPTDIAELTSASTSRFLASFSKAPLPQRNKMGRKSPFSAKDKEGNFNEEVLAKRLDNLFLKDADYTFFLGFGMPGFVESIWRRNREIFHRYTRFLDKIKKTRVKIFDSYIENMDYSTTMTQEKIFQKPEAIWIGMKNLYKIVKKLEKVTTTHLEVLDRRITRIQQNLQLVEEEQIIKHKKMQEMKEMLGQSIRSTLDQFDIIEGRLTKIEVTMKKRQDLEDEEQEVLEMLQLQQQAALQPLNPSPKPPCMKPSLGDKLEMKAFPSFQDLFVGSVGTPKSPRSSPESHQFVGLDAEMKREVDGDLNQNAPPIASFSRENSLETLKMANEDLGMMNESEIQTLENEKTRENEKTKKKYK